MQSDGDFLFHISTELDTRSASRTPERCGTGEDGAPCLRGGKSSGQDISGQEPTTPPPNYHPLLTTYTKSPDPPISDEAQLYTVPLEPSIMYRAFDPSLQSSANSMLATGDTMAGRFAAPSTFTPTNMVLNHQGAMTISPSQTDYNPDNSHASLQGFLTFDDGYQSRDGSGFLQYPIKQELRPNDTTTDDIQMDYEDSSPTTTTRTTSSSGGRRRQPEYVEPGSARAIYLEKNRKAASKCRSKQKMQQEDLVETARMVERKNKALKAEVELLKSNMEDLMNIVGQHTHCADGRLGSYVQREADRLASGVARVS